jgi:pSer/pThr/pTyr-binding forkhead associated (FHA) protein
MRLKRLLPWLSAHPDQGTVLLRVSEPADDERNIRVDAFPIVIGRCPGADVSLTDPWVSRIHCALRFVDGRLILRDLESHNGTCVNGKRVAEKEIDVDDVIDIGATAIVVAAIDAPVA